MESFSEEQNDLSKIKLKKLNKKASMIFDNRGNLIRMSLKNVFLKFGIENYNSKHILNICVDKNENNEEYNKIINIINIECKIKKFQNDIIESRKHNFDGKGFQSVITNLSEFGKDITTLRTYMNYDAKIITKGSLGYLDFSTDISNYKADVDITVKTVWNTDNNFGLIIYTDGIKLLNKVKL